MHDLVQEPTTHKPGSVSNVGETHLEPTSYISFGSLFLSNSQATATYERALEAFMTITRVPSRAPLNAFHGLLMKLTQSPYCVLFFAGS